MDGPRLCIRNQPTSSPDRSANTYSKSATRRPIRVGLPRRLCRSWLTEGCIWTQNRAFTESCEQPHHRGKARAPRPVTKPTGYQATGPNQVWSWDITYLAAAILGRFYRLYLVMDIYSRKIVAWEVYETETAEQAAEFIQHACWAEGVSRQQLVLHVDNGLPMRGATMMATLQKLGVIPSFSRPSVSDDNPYSKSLFRTLKYTPMFPSKPFDSLQAAREWVQGFVRWYNETHRHSGIRFVTPAERHRGQDREILAKRETVYAAAKHRHLERWSRHARNWNPVEEVWLNPDRKVASGVKKVETAA